MPNDFNDNRPMQTHSAKSGLWWLRIATFLLAAAAAASATYWLLKMRANPTPHLGAPVALAAPAALDMQAALRLLGASRSATAAPDSASSHFKLSGILAERNQKGYALLAVDGKAPKPVAVGARVNDSLLLQSLGPRSATLASSMDGPAALTLELPKTGPADTPGKPARAQARASPQRN